MCGTLVKVVKGITNKSDEEVLDIVSLRFAKNDDMESFVGGLMEADEALQLLDCDDIRVISRRTFFCFVVQGCVRCMAL